MPAAIIDFAHFAQFVTTLRGVNERSPPSGTHSVAPSLHPRLHRQSTGDNIDTVKQQGHVPLIQNPSIAHHVATVHNATVLLNAL
jgi:hypothetical protein